MLHGTISRQRVRDPARLSRPLLQQYTAQPLKQQLAWSVSREMISEVCAGSHLVLASPPRDLQCSRMPVQG
jgi:hypothetical protein